jgi:hypothetical protein
LAWLLRKIHKSAWIDKPEWLVGNEAPAVVLHDFEADANDLSLWWIEEDRSNLDRVVAALAGNCEYLGIVDVVLFPTELVEAAACGALAPTQGSCHDEHVASTWHRDLTQLSTHRVAELARVVYRDARSDFMRFPKAQTKRLLQAALEKSWLPSDRLLESLKKHL